MKLRTSILVSLLLAIIILNFGCALTPPNVPVCREKDIDRGRCTNIVDGKSFEINETEKFMDHDGVEKSWYELRPYFILVPISSWAALKAYIIKTCKKFKNCTEADPTVKSIDSMLEP